MRHPRRQSFGLSKAITTASLLGALGAAQATEGYFSHGYGTRSKGLCGASLAYAQDSLSGAANPALISHLGSRLDIGLDLFMPVRSFDASAASGGMFPLSPGTVKSGKPSFLIPDLGYNWKLRDGKSTAALLVYGNGGMNTAYKESVFGAGEAGVNLEQAFIAPTFASKLTDKTSLGASLIFCLQKFQATGIGSFAGFSNDPAHLSDNGSDFSRGYGIKLGASHRVNEKLSLAAAWQPKVAMSRFEKYSGLFAQGGKFDIPENYTIGFAYSQKPDDVWTFDVRTIRYSKVPAIGNPFASAGKLGDDNGPGFGWRDMTVFKLGHEWKPSPSLTLRLGVAHTRQPIPESDVLFNILAPGVQEWEFTAGITKQIRDGEFSFALMYSPTKRVSGTNPLAPSQRITLGMRQFEVEIGYSKKF